MSSALEAILVGILKDLGGQAHVAEVRNLMRERGARAPAEESLLIHAPADRVRSALKPSGLFRSSLGCIGQPHRACV